MYKDICRRYGWLKRTVPIAGQCSYANARGVGEVVVDSFIKNKKSYSRGLDSIICDDSRIAVCYVIVIVREGRILLRERNQNARPTIDECLLGHHSAGYAARDISPRFREGDDAHGPGTVEIAH